MKRIPTLCFLLISILVLAGCSSISTAEETSATTDDIIPEETEKEYYLPDVLEEHSEFEFLDNYVRENDIKYTIEYQQRIVGNTYLLNLLSFDVFESNGGIILSASSLWWDDPIIINITKEQCEKIISTDKNDDSLVLAINITEVKPLPIAYSADYEYSYKDIEIAEDEYMEIVDEDDIYAYVDIYPHDGRILKASCVEVYTLNDVLKYID